MKETCMCGFNWAFLTCEIEDRDFNCGIISPQTFVPGEPSPNPNFFLKKKYKKTLYQLIDGKFLNISILNYIIVF